MNTKTCYKCKETKELSEFHKDKSRKDGVQSSCINCKKKNRKYNKEYYLNNKDYYQHYYEQHYLDNKETHKENGKRWRTNNREKSNSIAARYRAKKKKSTPDWLTPTHWEQIEYYYYAAKVLTEYTGIPHEVDHIISLDKGGLHSPCNLQVITREANRKKSNKF